MPMDMDVAGEQGRIAKQRRIEPIAGRIRSMVMVMGKPAVNVICSVNRVSNTSASPSRLSVTTTSNSCGSGISSTNSQ